MAQDTWPDDFCCPKCGKTPEYTSVIGVRKYAMQRLDLPYFMCGKCRVCSYSKQLLKQTIKRWRKYNNPNLAVSDGQIFTESKETL